MHLGDLSSFLLRRGWGEEGFSGWLGPLCSELPQDWLSMAESSGQALGEPV